MELTWIIGMGEVLKARVLVHLVLRIVTMFVSQVTNGNVQYLEVVKMYNNFLIFHLHVATKVAKHYAQVQLFRNKNMK